MLLTIPSVISPADCKDIYQQLCSAEWTDGRETVGHLGAQVKRNLQLPESSLVRAQLGQRILDSLSKCPLFFAATLPQHILPPRFNCYQDSGTYGLHVDGAVMSLPGHQGQATQSMRSDISCTVFLSDPSSYVGGELVIADTYGEHSVKLPAGDAIIYPSSSLHKVTPVTQGRRISAFFWLQSTVRYPHQRQMLFELDQVIQRLHTQPGMENEAVHLACVYHNLLREWAYA